MPISAPNALDVRPLSRSRKGPAVLATFDALETGESFVLVDDREPHALHARLEVERPGQGQCKCLKEGPPVWHVRVARR